MRTTGVADAERSVAEGEARPLLTHEHTGENAVVVEVEERYDELGEVGEEDVGEVALVRSPGVELRRVRCTEADVPQGRNIDGCGREEGDSLNCL